MRLLVSVASAADASAALAGGADLIDAKDPRSGALGAVSAGVLRRIHATVNAARPVTAALGDASDEAAIEHAARIFARAGATLVKIGFGDISSGRGVEALIAAAVRGASHARSGVVAVAYADGRGAHGLSPADLIGVAARAGAQGVLLDTKDKQGPGLHQLMTTQALERWITGVHAAGLFAAVAGKLTAEHLPMVRDAGADIAGVRGAACEGGRAGRVVADKVRLLRSHVMSTTAQC